MVKRTGFTQHNFFYFIGRPFFYLALGLVYLLLLLISLLKKLILETCHLIRFWVKKIGQVKLKLPLLKITLPAWPKIPRLKPSFAWPKIKIRFGAKTVVFFLGILPSLGLALIFYSYILKDLPSPNNLQRPLALTTKLYDRNGKILYKIYREQNRTKLSLNEIPLTLRQATIAIEDKTFYQHPGISWQGIARAIYLLVFENKITGGSTITQQLVKNTLLTSEQTLKRKVKELVLALLVEKHYSKDQILEMYLNESGYGGASYGVEEASQKYFGKSVKSLSLAEMAFLAGLPASPTLFSPFGNHPEMAKIRQTQVLRRMAEDGYITEEQAQEALKEPLNFSPQKQEILAPHFVMYVKEILAKKYGERMVEEGGLEVTTSLDLDLQEKVQKIVQTEVEKLKPLRISNGAALVTQPQTGEILAMIGSKDYFATDIDGNYNVTTALRQPGSSIKPVTYSIALERGFTPATIIDDSPITFKVPGQPPYSPKNYDNRFHGNIPVRVALGSSYNVPAVKILSAFGVIEMIKRGQQLGITSWNDPSQYGLSLTLGGGEVKMTDMAVVYGTFADAGKRVSLKPILQVKDSSGKILEEETCNQEYVSQKKFDFRQLINQPVQAATTVCAEQVLEPKIAYLLTNILADNGARTPAFGPNSQLVIPGHEVAVKTGTTTNMRDNWTIGYTPSFLAATWVGNNDNSPMSYVASGVTGASPIWNKIMTLLLKDLPNETFNQPKEIVTVKICQLTGSLNCDGCPNPKEEYFIDGTQPKTKCDPEKIRQTLEEKAQLEEEQARQEKPE